MPLLFPIAYRWCRAKGLQNWEPWYFTDEPPDSPHAEAVERQRQLCAKALKAETGATFDAYLFARRQDRDDFAFFIVEGENVLDKVVTIHLSFSGRMEQKSPLTSEEVETSFFGWLREVVIPDIEDWMNEGDLAAEETAR